MFDYTKAALRKTIDDLKRIGYSFTLLSNAAYIGYLIYALCTNHSFMVVNAILLCISMAYLTFYLIITRFGKDLNSHKTEKKQVNRLVKWAKYGMKVYTLGTMLYSIAILGDEVGAFQLMLLILQIIFFVLQVLFALVCHVFEKRFEMFKTAIDMDVQAVLKPVTTVGNFFKKVTGKEIEPTPAPTKTQILLSGLAKANKEEVKALKAQKKQEKKAQKAQLREEKKAKKAALKADKAAGQKALPQAEIAPTDGQES